MSAVVTTDSTQAVPFAGPRQKLRAAARCLPGSPGVYMMRDATGDIIYIGKAVNLRRRVISYTAPSALKDRKTSRLVSRVASLSYIETDSELEALLVESRLIKEVQPEFNRQLREPESCCYVRIDPDEPIPRIDVVTRGKGDALYLGPLWNSSAVRDAVEAVSDVFRLRRCSGRLRPGSRKWACIFYEIGKCSGPCCGKVSKQDYLDSLFSAWDSLAGSSDEAAELLVERRGRLADRLKFEDARAVQMQIRALYEVAASGTGILDLSGDFAAVVPSCLAKRPVALVFSDRMLRSRMLCGPRYPDPGILEDVLSRAMSPGEDLLPGKPSVDDLLIVRSHLRRVGVAEHIVPLDPGVPASDLAHAVHASIHALRD